MGWTSRTRRPATADELHAGAGSGGSVRGPPRRQPAGHSAMSSRSRSRRSAMISSTVVPPATTPLRHRRGGEHIFDPVPEGGLD